MATIVIRDLDEARMIVLDTNVTSELTHPRGEPRVVAWTDEQQAGVTVIDPWTAAPVP